MKGETATCTFERLPGYVLAVMREGASFELADAVSCVEETWRVAGEKRTPALVDMRGVRSQSRAAREYFDGPEAERVLSRVALLVDSPVSRVIANFFLRVQRQRIPTRLFTDEPSAQAWLVAPP